MGAVDWLEGRDSDTTEVFWNACLSTSPTTKKSVLGAL